MKKYVITSTLILLVSVVAIFNIQKQVTQSLLVDDGKGVFDFEAHWKAGNIVSIVRHTERCDRSENQCFDGDKGITKIGVKEAVIIGEAYKKLPDSAMSIYNSPVKRTDQTAFAMFGNESIEKKWLREGCKENLYEDILKNKAKGENLILITHSTCIDSLGEKQSNKLINLDIGIHNKDTYGASFFLTVDKARNKIYVLGYLLAGQWNQAFQTTTDNS